ncbi:MAG TPA: SpoIIE family protein phosphatase [Flavobacteriales bacterium]|nr:SpoIIE family protein phosphatase [Flavobacteriales bacterium]
MSRKQKKYRIARIFGFDDLDRDEKLRRIILVRVLLLTAFFGLIWSVLYFTLGFKLGGTVVLSYVVLSLVNLAVFYVTKNYNPFRMVQLILILFLPFGTQLALGGFYSASGVVLASILCPLGALMFYTQRIARILFGLFLTVVAIAAVLEVTLPKHDVAIARNIVVMFYGMNTIVISSIVFALLLYFVAQRAIFQKMLAEKNKDLTDSIKYAKRIQEAILPSVKYMKTTFPDSFVLYKPKDIIAGDFYFFERVTENGKEYAVFAAADCTGHGVPGAMVSVVCSNALLRAINEFHLTNPGLILDKARELVIETFAHSDMQEGKTNDDYVKDGMDISIGVYELKSRELAWSGANNGLWIMRNQRTRLNQKTVYEPLRVNEQKELVGKKHTSSQTLEQAFQQRGNNMDLNAEWIDLRPDKQPIGNHSSQKNFTTHTIKLEPGDCLYMFTDGYEDQFGGEKGKKFKAANIKKMLESVLHKPMDQQYLRIGEIFENWKGELEQVDDVCMIGIRITE